MTEIKPVATEQKLKELFDFLSKIFYDEAVEFNEHYFTMSERYNEMLAQFKVDKELLLYIEEDDKIIAGLTAKNMNMENQKITLGVLGVAKEKRGKGYARQLINEFEKRCKNKEIKSIDLGARFRACPIYNALNYKASLMVQVFDFENIDSVRKANTYELKEKFGYQGAAYGFVFFEVPQTDEKYIEHFEKNVKTAHVQFVFEKEL